MDSNDVKKLLIEMRNMVSSIKRDQEKMINDIALIEKNQNSLNIEISKLQNNLQNQGYQIQMLKSGRISGPSSFVEALSPAAAANAPLRYINPAYRE
jgi:predicted  nucleic acid-binding Zn-ribbon protein